MTSNFKEIPLEVLAEWIDNYYNYCINNDMTINKNWLDARKFKTDDEIRLVYKYALEYNPVLIGQEWYEKIKQ